MHLSQMRLVLQDILNFLYFPNLKLMTPVCILHFTVKKNGRLWRSTYYAHAAPPTGAGVPNIPASKCTNLPEKGPTPRLKRGDARWG